MVLEGWNVSSSSYPTQLFGTKKVEPVNQSDSTDDQNKNDKTKQNKTKEALRTETMSIGVLFSRRRLRPSSAAERTESAQARRWSTDAGQRWSDAGHTHLSSTPHRLRGLAKQ